MCSSGYISPEWFKEPRLSQLREIYHATGCDPAPYTPYRGSPLQPMAGYDPSLPPQIDWVAINRAIAESS